MNDEEIEDPPSGGDEIPLSGTKRQRDESVFDT